ncbi:glycosyltransferase family 2 protein [Formosa sp. S-31]|uniref:glycosyltransferase family 2 protein n=1 Tax=Formosa sp. S-31 TaxID=2790949 RepID=UPI003EBD10FA
MEQSSKVTILMPVYNGEQYLKEAIDSVLNQSFKDFKLLIINDGSTDKTQSIIDSYCDPRIIAVKQDNMGVSRSLNKGLSMIQTPYVRRHDADDISEPWMLEWQVNYLEENPEVAAVSTRCHFMTVNSKVSPVHFQPKADIFEGQELIFAARKHFEPFSPVVHGTVLCRTKVFEEFKGYRTEFLTSEDNDLWLRIIEKYPFAILNKAPYKLRLSPGSATQMHKASIGFYRQLALDYADERMAKGDDPIMRGKGVTESLTDKTEQKEAFKTPEVGKVFAGNHLNFLYKVAVAAKDWKLANQLAKESLVVGWKLPKTWKALFFPLIGEDMVKRGVKLKKLLSW